VGADLYRNSKTYPEGYFRDSYNATNILWQLNLSWWADVIPMLDDECVLQADGIQTLLEMIEAEEVPPASAIKLGATAPQMDEEGDYDYSPEGWRQYFVEKRESLMAYLRSSLEGNDTIHCSL